MIVRLVLAVVLATTLAGCGLLQTSESPDEPGGGLGDLFSGLTNIGPQWSDYMPVRDGRTCTYTLEEMNSDDDTTQTWEHFNVSEESDGTHYTEKRATENTTKYEGEDGETYPPPAVTVTTDWVLADDGTLRSEPWLLTADVEPSEFAAFNREGIDASSDEFMVFPPIESLQQGESHSASIMVTWRAANPETQVEFDEALQPGESELKFRLDYTVEGVPPKEIATPTGTFTDVVGVSITHDAVEVLNANVEARSEFDETGESLTGSSSTETTWYARDIGAVQVEFPGYTASEAPPIKLVGCSE